MARLRTVLLIAAIALLWLCAVVLLQRALVRRLAQHYLATY